LGTKIKLCKHVPVISIPVSKPLAVNLQVTAPAGVKWVRLRYRSVNQDLPYQTLQMVPTGDKDSYKATVPADQIDPEYDLMYFIEAIIGPVADNQFSRRSIQANNIMAIPR
jgi:hypothetical protein